MVLVKEQTSSYTPINGRDSQDDIDICEHANLTTENATHPSHKRRRHNWLTVYLATITTLLCIFILVDITFRTRQCPAASQTDQDSFETTFGWNPEYMTLSHDQDHLWTDDLNSEDKVIELDSDGRTLHDIYGEDIGSPASLSLFHQLHCLASIRKALQDSQEGINIGIDWRDNGHWPHCFDYMRKTIMCWADSTLEQPQQLPNGSSASRIDGTAAVRRCRDTRAIYEFMDGHEAYNVERD